MRHPWIPCLCVASFALATSAQEPSPQDRFAAATRAEDGARLELWRAFAEHRSFHQRLQRQRDSEVEALANLLASMVADPNRPSGREAVRRVLENKLSNLELHASVAATLAASLSPRFASLRREDRAAQEVARQVLDALYPEETPFGTVWNESLLSHVPEVRAYREARETRRQALEALQRAIDPVRLHPAFSRTPEGMLLVPGGTYTVGPAKGWALGEAANARTVKIGSIYVDRHEVTNAQYREFLGSLSERQARPLYPSNWDRPEGDEEPRIPEGKEDHPVTGIDLVGAMEYADWAGKRLPSEDEWEVAARGGEAFLYPWGEVFDRRKTNCRSGPLGVVAAVGSHPEDRSPFGILDLAGNVSEWTVSQVDGKPLRRIPAEGQVLNVMTRGGSVASDESEESCAGTYRWPQPARGTKRSDLGFRCVKDAPER